MTEHALPITQPVPTEQNLEIDLTDFGPWREFAVILHNDEVHAIDEVMIQIVKAIQCSFGHAKDLTFKVHNEGRATVAISEKSKALQIAKVLREIQLKVTMRQVN